MLALLAEGLTNRQIAERLYLAEKTIKNYVTSVLAKMGMARRTEAAVYAARHLKPDVETAESRLDGTFAPGRPPATDDHGTMTTDRLGIRGPRRRTSAGSCCARPRSAGWPCRSPTTPTSSRSTTSSTGARSCSAPPRAPSSPQPCSAGASPSRSTATTPASGEAWSVVIKGRATEIERMQDVFDALDLPLFPWHASPKHRFVRIEPVDISGRRFHVSSTTSDRAAAPARGPAPGAGRGT